MLIRTDVTEKALIDIITVALLEDKECKAINAKVTSIERIEKDSTGCNWKSLAVSDLVPGEQDTSQTAEIIIKKIRRQYNLI